MKGWISDPYASIVVEVAPARMTASERRAEAHRQKQAGSASRFIDTAYPTVEEVVEQLQYMDRFDFHRWRPDRPVLRAGTHRYCFECSLEKS